MQLLGKCKSDRPDNYAPFKMEIKERTDSNYHIYKQLNQKKRNIFFLIFKTILLEDLARRNHLFLRIRSILGIHHFPFHGLLINFSILFFVYIIHAYAVYGCVCAFFRLIFDFDVLWKLINNCVEYNWKLQQRDWDAMHFVRLTHQQGITTPFNTFVLVVHQIVYILNCLAVSEQKCDINMSSHIDSSRFICQIGFNLLFKMFQHFNNHRRFFFCYRLCIFPFLNS